MWLLDHNLPAQLIPTLKSLNISCDSAASQGWAQLTNGELVTAAFNGGFRCIVTRDLKFGIAALAALSKRKEMAVVVIRLPQRKHEEFSDSVFNSTNGHNRAPIPVEWYNQPLSVDCGLLPNLKPMRRVGQTKQV